jgi:hypothetical protein
MTKVNWLDFGDIIKSYEWELIDDETIGSTPDICWVRNVKTGKKALFKPNSHGKNEAYCEYAASKIAGFLNIACARIEVGELFFKYGCLSYDCSDEKRYRIADGYSLFRCDLLFNNFQKDSKDQEYKNGLEISFKGLLPYISKQTEVELIKMMFLDCLIKNSDRHPGNYSFYINFQRVLCGLMPLYDHGHSLFESYRDISLFPYEGFAELPFDDLYRLLIKNHSEIVNDLLDKMKTAEAKELLIKLECYEFIWERLKNFQTLK